MVVVACVIANFSLSFSLFVFIYLNWRIFDWAWIVLVCIIKEKLWSL